MKRQAFIDNPLRRGWSREIISDNIREAMRRGRKQKQAIAMALRSARDAYRARHPKGALPKSLRYQPNAGLTYGTMPPCAQFASHFAEEVKGDRYSMWLAGADRRAARATLFERSRSQHYDVDELYQGIQELIERWHEGDDEAGSLAAAILGTLGFEWV